MNDNDQKNPEHLKQPEAIKLWAIVLALFASISLYHWSPLEQDVRTGLAIGLMAAILWLTEAIPLTVTSLCIPIVAVIMGVNDVNSALSYFANPIIFIFLGGFALAAALMKHKIDSSIGDRILSAARNKPILAIYLLFAATALISMWISNTATTAMMLPVALGIASRFEDDNKRTLIFLLIGTAYSASIGGIGSLVGTAPNAIAAASQKIMFVEWLQFGVPLMLLLLPAMILTLKWVLNPQCVSKYQAHAKEVDDQWGAGETSIFHRRLVIVIFLLVAAGWIGSEPLSQWLGIRKDFDSVVAILGIVLLVVSGSISWKEIEQNANWGILLLFGGGIALSAILKQTGASAFLADHLNAFLQGQSLWVILLVITAFVVFLTELASNTASAALLIPIFTSVATLLQIDAKVIAVIIATSASCAFMLPVATPPNAIVYGTGHIPQTMMMKTGLVLNLVCIVIIALFGWWWVH